MKNRNDYVEYRGSPQIGLPGIQKLLVDNFAGGGGASSGIEMALGRPVDIAINHDPIALEMHTINHPHTRHLCESIWDVDIEKATKGQPVGLAWFSPDCTHFSRARGGRPVRKSIRGLARIAVRWAVIARPDIIMIENVPEFISWGPVSQGKPIKGLEGICFEIYIKQLKALGYQVEWKMLKAHHYGAPTIRQRLFLIARCDNNPIVWPSVTHGPEKGLQPYIAASEHIDWSIPCPSIFERKKPLAEATCKRIARGIHKYIIETEKPFVLNDEKAASFIVKLRNGCIGSSLNEPLHTITAGATHHVLVTAFLAKHYTGATGSTLKGPLGTITSIDHHSLVSACLIPIDNVGGTGIPCHSINDPLRTITKENRHAIVNVFMVKYYGASYAQGMDEPIHTITSKGRFGLVTVTIDSQEYVIVDIGLRMLQPHELYGNQGFPTNYIINQDTKGNPLTKAKQNALVGNSVAPPVAEALVRANAPDELYYALPERMVA